MEANKIEPADFIVHWATGPVKACAQHAISLVRIGQAMGMHVHCSDYVGDEPCTNCINEAAKRKQAVDRT